MNLFDLTKWRQKSTRILFRKRFILFTIILIVLYVAIVVPTIVFAVPPPTYYGSVNNVDWTGYGNIDWWVDETVHFSGESFSEAEEVIDHLWVKTEGCVLCGGILKMQTDWTETNSVDNTWIVGKMGSGGEVTIGYCSWFILNPVTVISNESEHLAEDGQDSDDGETDNGDTLP